MEYNIFSPVKCLLKINGTLKGVIFLKPIKFSLTQGDVLEFFSVNNSFLPIVCLIGEKNENVCALENVNGNYIYPNIFPISPLPYEVVFSKNFSSSKLSVSVINDCSAKLLLENASSAKLFSLPFKATVPEVLFEKNRLIGLFFRKNNYVCVVKSENCERVLSKFAKEVRYENDTLILKNRLPTLLKHVVTEKFDYPFTDGTRHFRREKAVEEITPSYAGLCFLECLRLGDDVSEFLCPDFKGKEKIKDFLGDYLFVFKSPSDDFDYALIYENKIKFVSLKTKNDKICDIVTDD